MTYNFNPHRHVKIWLSKDKDSFLNLENRVRLVKMRDDNPEDEITFIYDSSLLSARAELELQTFCKQYGIIAKDVRTEIIPFCATDNQQTLIALYEDEIGNLDTGGNLAAASDILRWLKPVYDSGIYSDFDIEVSTRDFPATLTVDRPILFNLGSFGSAGDNHPTANNDIIAVIDSQAAQFQITRIQLAISTLCRRKPQSFSNSFLMAPEAPFYLNHNTELSARQRRAEIIEITADNQIFSQFVLGTQQNITTEKSQINSVLAAARLQRQIIKSNLQSSIGKNLPKIEYKQAQALLAIQDDEKFLEQVRQKLRMQLIKSSVIKSTGPGTIISSLFPLSSYSDETLKEVIAPFSIANYGIEKGFNSKNTLPLFASEQSLITHNDTLNQFEVSDVSWLEEGQNAIKEREKKITEQQLLITKSFSNIRDKFQEHMKAIENDLQGHFGFYRNKERQAKVQALKTILSYFSDNHFDITLFRANLPQFHTRDIAAGLKQSHTLKLIQELEQLTKQARSYLLVDDSGKTPVEPIPAPINSLNRME